MTRACTGLGPNKLPDVVVSRRWPSASLHGNRSCLSAAAYCSCGQLMAFSSGPRSSSCVSELTASHSQTTASPSRFLLADHLFSTAASLPAFKLPAPFASPTTDAKGKGRATDANALDGVDADGAEVEDVLFLGSLPKVSKWLRRICDVKGARRSTRAR